MAQPLGTVILAARKIPSLVDANVAIVGQGPMGQLFTATVRNLGARRIICVDPIAARLKVSERMGATDLINPQELDPVDAVQQLTDGLGADLVIEAVGHHDLALNQCIEMCRHSGQILQFGVPARGSTPIQLDDLFRKNLTLITSVDPDPDPNYGLAFRWIGERRIDVSPLVTHHFSLDEIQLAYDTFSDRRDGAIKVFLDFPNRGND
jgi:threonine dehydrogenase-like Zn-dependent dehydrogenase